MMDMVTITAAARVTGAEDMVAETEVRTEGTLGTGVRCDSDHIHHPNGRPPLSMTSASASMGVPPGLSQVGVPTSAAAALLLPRVISHLIPGPAVGIEAGVIHYDLFS